MAYTAGELMVTTAARMISDGNVVFVGMRLPLLAFLLAKETHAPDAIGLFENGVVRDIPALGPIVTMGDPPNLAKALLCGDMMEVMGYLQKGRVDVGFIGGAQIDRFGNLNTTWIGPEEDRRVRLPGSGGRGGYRLAESQTPGNHDPPEAAICREGGLCYFAGIRLRRYLAAGHRPCEGWPGSRDHHVGCAAFRFHYTRSDADPTAPIDFGGPGKAGNRMGFESCI